MKTEAAAQAPTARSNTTSHDPRPQRWLADLEQALLDASPRRGGAAGGEREAPTPRFDAPMAATAAPGGRVVATAGHGPPANTRQVERVDSAPRSARLPSDAQQGAAAAHDPEARPAATSQDPRLESAQASTSPPWLQARNLVDDAPGGAQPLEPIAMSRPALGNAAHHTETMTPAAPRPVSRTASSAWAARSPQSADSVAGDEEAVDARVPDERAPDYAKRLLQVSGGEDLQLNLRDAALPPARHTSVALALFAQLHQAGVPLRRVYINGQRFEHGASPNPIPPIDKE